ncbi:MAG: hypothetical protein ACREQN_11765 [Candidatus Binataceae bacterium]
MHHALAVTAYVCLVVAFSLMILGNRLSKHYLKHRPPAPQPEEGRVHPYISGGETVYLTAREAIFVGKPLMVLVLIPWVLSVLSIVVASL